MFSDRISEGPRILLENLSLDTRVTCTRVTCSFPVEETIFEHFCQHFKQKVACVAAALGAFVNLINFLAPSINIATNKFP